MSNVEDGNGGNENNGTVAPEAPASEFTVSVSGSVSNSIKVPSGTTVGDALKKMGIETKSYQFRDHGKLAGFTRKVEADTELTATAKTKAG